MLELDDFITAVTAGSNVHICIHDISGITQYAPFCISAARKIHAARFCECAKSLCGGLKLCMKCRALENEKAEREAKLFWGRCPFGVTEIVYPTFSKGRVLCFVCVGHIADDIESVRKKITKTAYILKSSPNSVLEAADYLQSCTDIDRYILLAQAISEYIVTLYNTYGIPLGNSAYHEAVAYATQYADIYYNREISINDVAKKYEMNDKYLGRLFKKQTGESFCRYLNRTRITHAKYLLGGTAAPIIEIALECGYNNVTYFNRVFKEAEGMSPMEYRAKTGKIGRK